MSDMSHAGNMDTDMGDLESTGASPQPPMNVEGHASAHGQSAHGGTSQTGETSQQGTPRARSVSPSRQAALTARIPSRITGISKTTTRNVTPPRTRFSRADAASALQQTAEMQRQTHQTAQSAVGQADAALQEARKAAMETEAVKKTVQEALSSYFEASTSLSAQQVSKLTQDTYAEFQAAYKEHSSLKDSLRAQENETLRLK